jgi:hypothetical protein
MKPKSRSGVMSTLSDTGYDFGTIRRAIPLVAEAQPAEASKEAVERKMFFYCLDRQLMETCEETPTVARIQTTGDGSGFRVLPRKSIAINHALA